jgi:hypothetical protein
MEAIENFKIKLLKLSFNISFDMHCIKTLKSLNDYLESKNKYHTYDYDIRKIIDLLIYDFSEYDIIKRLQEIKNLKKDSSTKKSFLIRYGEIEGEKRYLKRSEKQKITSTKEYLIDKFGEEQSTLILKSKCPNNLDTLINKCGEEEGRKKYDNYIKNYKFGNSLEGYIKKYGKETGKKLYDKRQETYAVVNTKEGYIQRHGEKEGLLKWENKNKKNSYKKSKQYYIDTYGEDGKIIFKDHTWYGNIRRKHGNKWFENFLKEKRNKSKIPHKEKYIQIYGEIEGNKKYNEYILKQKYAHTIEYYIEKYGEEQGKIEYIKAKKRLIDNLINKKNASDISKNLFEILKNKLNDEYCKFMGNNTEMFIYDEVTNKLFFYDFTYNNKIIEFNGDFWHMNPLKYNENDVNKMTHIYAKDIWENDKYKQELASKHEYKIKIIWESVYHKNKEEIINECLNFLKNE